MARDKEAEAFWQARNVDPKTKPTACSFCGHTYYRPCSESQHKMCANFLVVQRRAAKAKAR